MPVTGTGGPTLEFLPYGRHATQVGYTPVHFLPVIPLLTVLYSKSSQLLLL